MGVFAGLWTRYLTLTSPRIGRTGKPTSQVPSEYFIQSHVHRSLTSVIRRELVHATWQKCRQSSINTCTYAVAGEKVLNSKHAPVAQEFLKKGSPRCLRGKIWCQVLGSEATVDNSKYFDQLKSNVLTYDLLIDKLTIKDVQLTASNDDQYFVFEDLLYQILLCFSRDTEILSIFERSSASPLYGPLKNKSSNTENLVVYPPSGIIPFHGFTMYATPFCYLYDDVIALYFTFRAFYLRYFYHLHQVSSDEQSILSLCILFYRLLQRYEPQLFLHFKTIHIHPIKIVFKWIMRCFSGHLPPDQILYLWDLILAYDSLEIISVLAVAILSFRRDNLMQVDTLQNVEVKIFFKVIKKLIFCG